MASSVDSATGLEFYDLSHPWGHGVPNWPYFEDVKIERLHYHAKSGVLTQRITTVMHSTTHIDAPAHVIENTPFIDELPLEKFFGAGVAVSIPKKKWEVITPEDLDNARPRIQKGDIVVINTGWHHKFGDNSEYYAYSPGLYKVAGEWLADKGVKMVGVDQQALDHPLATAIGPHRNGPLLPHLNDEYKAQYGRDIIEDFPLWEPAHRALLSKGIPGIENVGGDLDKVTGRRCTFIAFPWRWMKGDGCIIRLVAVIDPKGESRIETGEVA
ncbi:MAG: cyclase family protein [Dehalococcoidia bacterium]